MKPSNSSKKAKLVWPSVCLVIGIILFVINMKLINILADNSSITAKVTKTVKVIQVAKNQSFFGTSVAYIVDDPEGNDRISVMETDSYARYKAGDEIQLKITKYKNAPTDIDLKN